MSENRTRTRSKPLPDHAEFAGRPGVVGPFPGELAKEGHMNSPKNAPRRVKKLELYPESLETRSLLTGGTGNLIAILPGTIATAKEVGTVSFTLSKPHFTVPKGKVTLGIDIVPDAVNTFKPQI